MMNLSASTGDARDMGSIPGSGMIPWRRKWQPTPIFLPGKSRGQRSLVGCSHKESDTTDQLSTHTVHTDHSFNTHLYWCLLSAKHCPGCQDSKWMRHRLQSVYSHLAAINGLVYKLVYIPVRYRNSDQEWEVAVSEAAKGKGSSSPFKKSFAFSLSLSLNSSVGFMCLCVWYIYWVVRLSLQWIVGHFHHPKKKPWLC